MHVENFIDQIEKELPPLSTTRNLVKLGLFASKHAAVKSRNSGTKPEFLKLSEKRIVYPRDAIVEWLKQRHQITKNGLPTPKEEGVTL